MRALALVAAITLAACRPAPTAAPEIGNRPSHTDDRPRALLRGPITQASLEQLLTERFAVQITERTFTPEWNGIADEVIGELTAMGWTDIDDVARAIPRDLEIRGAVQFTVDNPANFPGTLRDVMILHDARRYFTRAWNNHWASLAPGDLQVYRAYRIDMTPIIKAGVMRDDGS